MTQSQTLLERGQVVGVRRQTWLVDMLVENSKLERNSFTWGLTSPDIRKLRALHAACGWTDIPTACQFLLDHEEGDIKTTCKKSRKKKKPGHYRWPVDIRDEVPARLLTFNAQCHAEEVRIGSANATRKNAATKQPSNSPSRDDEMLGRP